MCRLVDPQVRQLLGTAPLDASSGQDLARGAAANAKVRPLPMIGSCSCCTELVKYLVPSIPFVPWPAFSCKGFLPGCPQAQTLTFKQACSVCDSEHIAQSSVCSYTLLQPTWAFGCCRVDLDFFPCGRSFCCYPPGMPWIQQLTDGSAIFMGPWPCHPLEAFELLYLTFSWGSVISQVSSVPLLVRPLQRHVCSAVFCLPGCSPSQRLIPFPRFPSMVQPGGPCTQLAPKRRIGGSGTSASFLYDSDWFMLCVAARLIIPFFISLLLLQLVILSQMLFLRIPKPFSSARRDADHHLSFYPTSLALCWNVGTAAAARPAGLDWRPVRLRTRRKTHSASTGIGPWQRLGVILFGFAQLPTCVWAAPEGFADALHAAQNLLEGIPDPMNPDQPPQADRHPASAGPLPEDAPPDARQTPKHCVILQFGFPAQHLLVYEQLPCSEQAFIQGATDLQASSMDDHTLHPTEPQIADGLATLVAVPNWMHNTDKTVYVLDFSFWNGPVYAVADWRFVTLSSLAADARRFCPVPWQVSIGRHDVPFPADGHIFAVPGDVFRFTPQGHPAEPRPFLRQMVADAKLWSDNPPSIPRELTSHRWLALRSHVTRTPTYDGASQQELLQVVATSCHSEVNELDFGLPLKDSSLATLVYHGYDIRGVVAAEPCSISGHRLGSFVFIDPRLLGLAPSFRFCPAGWVDLTFFISFLDLKIPQGYELAASGVPLAEDRVQVTDCCTMQLRFVPSGVSVCSAPHRRSSSNLADFGLSPDAPEPAGAHQAIPTQFPGPAATDTPDPEVVLGVATPPLRDDHMSQCSFLIFSVDFQPETITLDLALPCQLEDVMQKLADARDSDVAVYFDNLVPAYPQPDDSFGAVLALPEWFQHDAIVLVDARSIDGRMFAAVFRGRLNRSSILLHLQIEDKPDLLVFSRGALLDADSWFSFQSGETVLIVLQGFHPIPHLQLEDMLQQPQSWDDSLPVLEGPHFPLFLVLSDGGQHQVPVDVEQVRSFADFQQHTSQVLQFSSEHPVFCSSVPRIRDLAVYGHFCKAVLVATERVQRLPMPPSRLSLYTPIVFLDCRRMLQGFTWLAADQGLVDLDRLIAQYQANAPTGYCPNVRGADTEMHFGRPYLRVVYSTLLTVTFVADMPSSDEDASSDAFHDESSAESSDGDTPDTPQEPESGDTRNAMTSSHDLRDRSRSPRPRDHQADGASDEHVRNSCPAKLSISPPIELSADKWTSGSIAIDLTLCPPPGTVFKHCLPTGFLGHDADWFRWDVLDSVTSAPSDPELKAEHSMRPCEGCPSSVEILYGPHWRAVANSCLSLKRISDHRKHTSSPSDAPPGAWDTPGGTSLLSLSLRQAPVTQTVRIALKLTRSPH